MCDGDNLTGADNQQERLASYVAGFVDGEGSFHVALQRNHSTRLKWQLVPEFHVSQHECRKELLDLVREVLGCGRIQRNHGNSSDNTLVLVVRNRRDLLEKVIPFFENHPLLSTKRKDFDIFAEIVRKMDGGVHREAEGFLSLAKLALAMNRGGRFRRVSVDNVARILRDHTPDSPIEGEKIWSDLHGDMQSQAEMTWPATVSKSGGCE
jgi:hypothetical protein